jgi:hypothetical protein
LACTITDTVREVVSSSRRSIWCCTAVVAIGPTVRPWQTARP